MRKIYFSMMALALAMSACTSDEIAYESNPVKNAAEQPMTFSVSAKNMTRATAMENLGLYNFGVYAYKTTSASETEVVMNNYLVGYHGTDASSNPVGYYTTGDEKTYGTSDNLTDGISQWFYEGLGKTEYNYTGTDGYYTTANTDKLSANPKQYLKHWDYSAQKMEFYAYAPYGAGTVTRTDVSGTLHTKVAFGEVTGGTALGNNFMVATPVERTPKQVSPKYNEDIPLTFKRMMGKVRLVFYDAVDGYDVQIDDYGTGGVQANPSVINAETGAIEAGKIVTKLDGVTYDYTDGKTTVGAADKSGDALVFAKPVGESTTIRFENVDYTHNKIQESRPAALANASSQSPTAYYCVPCGGTSASPVNDALVFHISFTLYSLDTNEKIQVKNATVTVPAAYTQWGSNTLYTYIFKITKETNGGTGDDDDPKGLYPIVFDGIQVEDFAAHDVETDWVVSQVSLNKQLLTLAVDDNATLTATLNYVTASDEVGGTAVKWTSDNTDVVEVVTATTNIATGEQATSTQIHAKAAGTATITATSVYNGQKATCIVTVK